MPKTTNTKKVFSTLGASNHVEEEREENDFYSTEPAAGRLESKPD
jgi:hypothetical protein